MVVITPIPVGASMEPDPGGPGNLLSIGSFIFTGIQLQWSQTPEGLETTHRLPRASSREGFNGARPRRAWKLGDIGGRGVRSNASMEPDPGGPGNTDQPRTEIDLFKLQWSQTPEGLETCPCGRRSRPGRRASMEPDPGGPGNRHYLTHSYPTHNTTFCEQPSVLPFAGSRHQLCSTTPFNISRCLATDASAPGWHRTTDPLASSIVTKQSFQDVSPLLLFTCPPPPAQNT